MTGLLSQALPWITPPVVGAIIGYVTNDIAIRMLFRPLHEVRVFGVRVPFTPGIFPKERYTLSKSIGQMVSRELITDEALRKQIHSEKTQAALAGSVSSFTDSVLSRPLSSLSQPYARFVNATLQEAIGGLLSRFFGSRALIYLVRDLAARVVGSLSAIKVREALDRVGLRAVVVDRLLPLLADPGARESVSRSLADAVGNNAAGLLSDELVGSLSEPLGAYAPLAVDRIVEWLRSADTHGLLEVRGRALLTDILNKLSGFQRFILTAGQFNRTLDDKMPEIVDETIDAIERFARDPAQQARIIGGLLDAVKDWRDAASVGKKRPAETVSGMAYRLVNGLLSSLEKKETRAAVYDFLEARLLARGDQGLGAFARAAFGVRDTDLVDRLSEAALSFLSRPDTAQGISRELLGLVSRYIAENGAMTVGEVLRIQREDKERIDAFLLGKLVELIDTRVPEILAGVDVEDLVVQKIDALDVQDVEKLLRQVIAEHLKWINVFGAILGFAIGLLQDLMKLLHLS